MILIELDAEGGRLKDVEGANTETSRGPELIVGRRLGDDERRLINYKGLCFLGRGAQLGGCDWAELDTESGSGGRGLVPGETAASGTWRGNGERSGKIG